MSLKISKAFFQSKSIDQSKHWLSIASERVNQIKATPGNDSFDTTMGIFVYNIYSASLVWHDYLNPSRDPPSHPPISNLTAFRLVQNAISNLPLPLKNSIKTVKLVVKTCKKMAALSILSSDAKQWLNIALRLVDEVAKHIDNRAEYANNINNRAEYANNINSNAENAKHINNNAEKSKSTNKFLIGFQKDLLLLIITATIKEKNASETSSMIQNGFQLLKEDSNFYVLWIKSLELSSATPEEFIKVFALAKEHCFHLQIESSLTDSSGIISAPIFSKKDLQNLVALIFLISKSSSPETAFPCISQVMPILHQSTITSPLITSDTNPIASLSILSIYLLCETKSPTALEQIQKIIESVEWDPISKEGRACLLLLWKQGDSIALEKKWSEAIEWYRAACDVLSINTSDSKNKASLYRKISICQSELHRYQDALDFCNKCAEVEQSDLGSISPTTQFFLFMNLFKLDKIDEAFDHLCMISFSERSDFYVAAADLATESNKKSIVLKILKEAGKYMHLVPVRGNAVVIIRHLVHLSIDEFVDCSNHDETLISAAKKIYDYISMAFNMLSSLLKIDTGSNQTGSAIWKAEIEGFFRACWNFALLVHQTLPEEFSLIHSLFHCVCNLIYLLPKEDQSDLHRKSLKSSLFIQLIMSCYLSRIENDTQIITRGLQEMEQFNKVSQSLIESIDATEEEKCDYTGQTIQLSILQFELLLRKNEPDEALSKIMDPRIWSLTVASQCLDTVLLMPSSSSFSTVSVSILEKLLSDVVRDGNDSSQKDHFDIQFYTKWSRVLIQTYLELNLFEKLSDFLDQFETLLAHSSLPLVPSNDSFQNDLLWTCIAVWNVSTDLWSVNDFEGAKQWMQIALSFASYCEPDCPQIKAMREAYSEFLGSISSVEK